MNYSQLMLGGLGLLGILIHNVFQLNSLNKAANGNYKFGQYIKVEKYSIIASVLIVIAAIFTVQEIKQLEQVQNYLGLAFIAIGYMGQSILVKYMGKASDKLK